MDNRCMQKCKWYPVSLFSYGRGHGQDQYRLMVDAGGWHGSCGLFNVGLGPEAIDILAKPKETHFCGSVIATFEVSALHRKLWVAHG